MPAISNKNPEIRTLIPELMGGIGSGLVRQDPHRPDTTWLRPAQISTSIRSTYVIPGDWPGKPDDWFASDAPTYPLRRQNNVEYLIDGVPTFEAMVEAIETATGPEHFIVLLGWACHAEFVLSKHGTRCAGAKRTLLAIIEERIKMGVTARVLLYNNRVTDPNFFGNSVELDTKQAFDYLEPLKPPRPTPAKIRCIIDDAVKVAGSLHQSRGSHHQKVLLVYGSEGLVGFLGGVDVNEDRVSPTKIRAIAGPELFKVAGPLHDVHARVWGEAADDLMVLATNRWNFAVPRDYTPELEDDGKGGRARVQYARGVDIEDMTVLLERARAKAASPPGPHRYVKIAQTVGNPDLAKLQDNGAWAMVKHAIGRAKKFIYMEDQYLWSLDAAEELGKAAARLAHVTILLPPDDPLGANIRHRALKRMKEVAGADAQKIRIYVIRGPDHQYVHAKMFVFDDEYLLAGSANCNNRGYFTDSEVNAGVADPEWSEKTGPRGGQWWALELSLAHKLRIELWAEHLRLPADALIDGVAAEVHWRFHRPEASIVPYTLETTHDAGATGGPCKRRCLWHEYPYSNSDDDSSTYSILDPKI